MEVNGTETDGAEVRLAPHLHLVAYYYEQISGVDGTESRRPGSGTGPRKIPARPPQKYQEKITTSNNCLALPLRNQSGMMKGT